MSINDKGLFIEPISLTGYDLSPHPLAITNAESTTKWLMGIQAKINSFINDSNNLLTKSVEYTDETYSDMKKRYDEMMKSIADGSFLLDGSIELDKLSSDLMLNIQKTIIEYLRNTARFVTFGLSDDGYFKAYIPDSWDNIDFSTDVDGHLILKMMD